MKILIYFISMSLFASDDSNPSFPCQIICEGDEGAMSISSAQFEPVDSWSSCTTQKALIDQSSYRHNLLIIKIINKALSDAKAVHLSYFTNRKETSGPKESTNLDVQMRDEDAVLGEHQYQTTAKNGKETSVRLIDTQERNLEIRLGSGWVYELRADNCFTAPLKYSWRCSTRASHCQAVGGSSASSKAK